MQACTNENACHCGQENNTYVLNFMQEQTYQYSKTFHNSRFFKLFDRTFPLIAPILLLLLITGGCNKTSPSSAGHLQADIKQMILLLEAGRYREFVRGYDALFFAELSQSGQSNSELKETSVELLKSRTAVLLLQDLRLASKENPQKFEEHADGRLTAVVKIRRADGTREDLGFRLFPNEANWKVMTPLY